ncbi:MAG: cbb3-type cytochrome oxidase assembly protein CcoS [Balneola sp.]|jgi:cbb3-type cytochrome oxidase maturation protein|uniref:cbb3-type cytochrome oxidase assembly protein CcoS n=1 Tax=Balneola sp. EhC07 TaxID=1849360 RepID=UPI0007F50164|nr:cbb3-type cytochrome oxidase assembly protein CcoS [Balneola sp. EhC07]MAB66981.1 cbb3-type cytochrome oxidase assembly protein CcoS [Bacteroidota bacterium]MBO6571136.1 cbb3-type cytochrome oxidase assembly protein CcoS [Balneola sp.]MBR9917004.1 cbb3-type cytochrome oxidase assembly protein CcoS [bacterium]OAN59668.1 cytochrome oxidase maturation protein, cbb3-type [Balneola sp. EhC07]HCI71047.1 cbb3-type cytochrome oxidase assembly protein CcoS [Balneola sp.]|tara:strand:+ start:982 stop:1167 length:186 start_codon:yes stop_codon:yes gene_type:complete
MGVIFFLILFSISVALIFLAAFFWAVKTGQFDDQYTPSVRILFDEKKSSTKNKTQTTKRDS